MSHATPSEIHDHVYGFRASAHVPTCADCRAAAETVAAERPAIRDALTEEPVVPPARLLRHRRLPLSALAAAALLLAVLGGLLFHRQGERTPADAGQAAPDDAVDRLIAELRSSHPLRREIAVLALKAYGEAAIEKIRTAKVDPSLFGSYRLKPRDAALAARLDAGRIEFSLENARIDEMLTALGKAADVKIVLDPAIQGELDLARRTTFKVKDLSPTTCFKLLLSQMGLDFRAEEGQVVVLDPRATAAPSLPRAPIRIGRDRAAAERFLELTGSDSPEQREEGLDGLRRLGFAAEEPLWDALSKADPDVRARAADLLRWLYTPGESGEAPAPRRTAGVRKAAHEKTLSIDLNNAPLTAAADYVREITGVNVHVSGIASPDAASITFKGTDLPAHSALVLLLEPQGMAYLVKDATILIVPADQVPKGASLVRNFWTAPEEARAIERQLASLGSSLPSDRDAAAAGLARLGDRGIGILERASGLLEGEARARCRALLASLDPSGLESPPAGGLQRRTPLQQAVLNRTADLAAEAKDLEALIKPYGEKVVFKSKASRTFTFVAKGVTLETLLKALTPPQGLDFYLDGQTVVVDTAANVRAALAR